MTADPSGYFSQFGGIATSMLSQFAGGNATDSSSAYGQKMGGGAGAAAGAIGAVGGVASGITKAVRADTGKERAQGVLDTAASAASAAGPWGMVAAAPLQLVSALLNIKGPRERRKERREADQAQQYAIQEQAGRSGIRSSNPSRSAGIAATPLTTVSLGQPAPSFPSS